jgi:hypothetical protein
VELRDHARAAVALTRTPRRSASPTASCCRPTGCARCRWARPRAPLEYRTEGRYFLSDEGALPLVYIFDNDNPATYDAALVAAMELAMCAALAYPVTKSTALRDSLGAELKEVLRTGARNVDGQDDPPETLGDSSRCTPRRFGPTCLGCGDAEAHPQSDQFQRRRDLAADARAQRRQARYQNGADTIENGLVDVHGGVVRRNGTALLWPRQAVAGTRKVRLVRYVFNEGPGVHARIRAPVHALL